MQSVSTSRRGILTPQAVGTQFRLTRHAPAADLEAFVERHWAVRWDLRGGPPHLQETLPNPHVDLVIMAGRSAVHGAGTRRFEILLAGQGAAVATKFRPGAFFPFVRVPMTELTDRGLPLRALFGAEGDALEAEVLACADEAGQVAALEAFIRSRLPPPDPRIGQIAAVVAAAVASRGAARVPDLAARVGLPERTLQRLFKKYVGVGPKAVIRHARLHEAAEQVAAGRVDWAALAHELGYCDQAHFIRDFKAQLGRSPTEYAAECAAPARPRSLA